MTSHLSIGHKCCSLSQLFTIVIVATMELLLSIPTLSVTYQEPTGMDHTLPGHQISISTTVNGDRCHCSLFGCHVHHGCVHHCGCVCHCGHVGCGQCIQRHGTLEGVVGCSTWGVVRSSPDLGGGWWDVGSHQLLRWVGNHIHCLATWHWGFQWEFIRG